MRASDRKSILLVEDERLVALATKAGLEKLGYEVRVADSGEAAIATATGGDVPDLVLMDIDLGQGMDGTEAASAILGKRDLPVVFLSSHIEPEIVEKTGKITSYGYVVKNSGLTILDASMKMAFRLFEANRSVKAANAKLEATFDALPDLLFELDIDGRYYDLHSPQADLLYRPVPDLVGRRVEEVLPPEPAAIIMSAVREAHEKGSSAGKRYQLAVGSGLRWFETSVSCIVSSADKPRFIFLARDITERQSIEERLKAKSEELDSYFESALDLLCIADTGGHFLRLNPEWEKVLGYPVQELEGRLFLDLVHPDDLKDTLAAIATLDSQVEVASFTNRYRHKDGSWRWIEWRSHPRGNMIYAVARDITESRRAEEEIRTLLAEKDIVLREVHHRLKNNMGAIAGFLSLQLGSTANEVARGALEIAVGRVQSMMLLYERLYQSGNYLSISVREYLPDVIDQVVANFSGRAAVRVERDIEDISLDAKRMQPLGIIVNELLTNAMKYAFNGRSEGRIRVAVHAVGDRITVSVGDDGIGLPASFDPENPGGFGLTLVNGLAEQMHGQATFSHGQGTEVIIEFPR